MFLEADCFRIRVRSADSSADGAFGMTRWELADFGRETAKTKSKVERPQVFRVVRERPELHLRRTEKSKAPRATTAFALAEAPGDGAAFQRETFCGFLCN
jgi:hypothetical protein